MENKIPIDAFDDCTQALHDLAIACGWEGGDA